MTESELRHWLGSGPFKRAEAYLQSGKIVERHVSPEGDVEAYWDATGDAPHITLYGAYPKLVFECAAPHGRPGRMCDHVAALALAWVRAPSSFRLSTNGGRAGDRYDEEDEARGKGGADMAAPGRIISGVREAPDASDTLCLQPPDVRAEYARLLDELNLADLRELAARRGVALSSAKREPIVDTLADALCQPESLRAAWETLSPQARLAFKILPFLLAFPGDTQRSHLKQALQTLDGPVATRLDAVLQELWSAGLVFVNRYGLLSYPRSVVYYLPPAPGFIQLLNETNPQDGRGLRAGPPAGPLDFVLLATRLLLMLKAESGRLRGRPLPPAHPLLKRLPSLQNWPYVPAELDALAKEQNPAGAAYHLSFTIPPAPSPLPDEVRKTLARALGVDGERLDFTLRLLAELGTIEVSPGQPLTVNEAQSADFIRQPPAGRLVPLFNAWVNMTGWSEFDRLAARRPPIVLRHRGNANALSYVQVLEGLSHVRAALVMQIRNAPVGPWADVKALAIRARGLNIVNGVWPPMYNACYPDWNKRVPNLAQAADWNAIYGPYVEAVLTGPLHWLGVVELAYHKGQLVAFRPTEYGAFLFRQRESFTLPAVAGQGAALTFATGGELCLRAEAAGSDLLALMSLLGEARSGARGELAYAVTAEGASRAFEAGWEVEKILSTLQQAAGKPVPEPLAQTLRAWRRNFGNVQVYSNVALLELADDYVLAELLAGTALSQHLLYRFSPRLVAIHPEGIEDLRAELVKKGYTPRVEA